MRNKNNRFLICDAVIENYYKDEETGNNIKCGLLATKKLGFNSKKEILWNLICMIISHMQNITRTITFFSIPQILIQHYYTELKKILLLRT